MIYNNTIIVHDALIDGTEFERKFENAEWSTTGNYLLISQNNMKTVISLKDVKRIEVIRNKENSTEL